MPARHTPLAGLAPALFAACLAHADGAPPAPEAQYIEEARATVNQAMQTLGGELKQALQDGGPAHAISVCKDKAPKIAAAVSEARGVKLRRVTTKNRNPKSVPDAWEAKVLEDFEQRLAKGEPAASLEHAEVVEDGNGRTFRYMKGLVTQGLCLTCHGTPETIPEAVKAKLAVEYPNDQATGYRLNMLRGAASLKKPL